MVEDTANSHARQHLIDGLERLEAAAESVVKMTDIEERKPEVRIESEKMECIIKRLWTSSVIRSRRIAVQEATSLAENKAVEVENAKVDTMKELADVQPALDTARSALDSINADDIFELKSYKQLRNLFKTSWNLLWIFTVVP